MKFFQFFHRLGCVGYTILGVLGSFLLMPVAYFVLNTGDEKWIAIASMLELAVISLVAAPVVVFWRKPDWAIAAIIWIPIYFVSYLALVISYNTIGNGYRLGQNTYFNEWAGFFLSLVIYQLPVLLIYLTQYKKTGDGIFNPNIERKQKRKATASLVKALRHPNRQTRFSAAKVLAEMPDPRVTPKLITAYHANNDEGIQGYILQALRGAKDARAYNIFLEILTSNKPRHQRVEAARGLRDLKDQRAYPHLLEAIHSDPDDWVVSEAIFGVGDLGGVSAFPTLLEAMRNQTRDIAGAAANAISSLDHPQVMDALIEALENPKARPTAVMKLLERKDSRGIDAVAWKLENDPFGVHDLLSLIIRVGTPENPRIRAWMAADQGQLEQAASYGEAAIKPLEAYYLWSKANRALPAIQILENIGSQKAAPALGMRLMSQKEIVEGPEEEVSIREAAARALGKLGGVQAVEALCEALQNPVLHIRLGDIQDYPVSLAKVQCAAAAALAEIGDRRAVPCLLEASRSENPTLAYAAAKALEKIGGQ